jgi:hypothetical protein
MAVVIGSAKVTILSIIDCSLCTVAHMGLAPAPAVSAEMLYHIVIFFLVRIAIALLWLRLRKIRTAIGRQG